LEDMPAADFTRRVWSSIFERFFQMQDFIPTEFFSRDLNQYKSIGEVEAATTAALPLYRAHQEKKDYLDAEQGSDLIYDGQDWSIYIPRNKGAACQLGKGTEWCTAAPGLDYYEQYHKENDPLFVFVNKKNPEEKYQFHYGTEQFMDVRDEDVSGHVFTELNKLLLGNVKSLPNIVTRTVQLDKSEVLTFRNSESKQDLYTVSFYPVLSNGEHWKSATVDNIYHRIDGPCYSIFRSRSFAFGQNFDLSWAYKGEEVANIIGREDPAGLSMNVKFNLKKDPFKKMQEIENVEIPELIQISEDRPQVNVKDALYRRKEFQSLDKQARLIIESKMKADKGAKQLQMKEHKKSLKLVIGAKRQ